MRDHIDSLMQDPKVLLCTLGRTPLITIGRALRDEGFIVLPSRYHEAGVDGLVRVMPDLALVECGHEAADSDAFRALAASTGTRVFLFTSASGAPGPTGDAVAMQLDYGDAFPVLEYTGDCRALAGVVRDMVGREPVSRE